MTVNATIQEGAQDAKEALNDKKLRDDVPLKDESPDEWSPSTNLWDDIKLGLSLGLPISFGQWVRFSSGMVLSVLLGRRDTYLLAGVSSAMVWSEPLDELVRGVGSQVSALGAQAYGAGNFKMVGTWCQMSLILATIVGIPLACLKMATGPILLFLGVPSIVADPAGEFATDVAFAQILELYTVVLVGYLAAQALMSADVGVALMQLIFGSLAVWFFLDVMNVGIFGLAMVMNVRRISHLILLTLVAKFAYKGFDKCWSPPRFAEVMNKERWVILISQVVPAGIDYAMQKINGSVNLAIAARLGQKQVAAFDLICQLNLCLNGPIWGICMGFSILTAHRLGSGHARKARGMLISGAVVNYSILGFLAVAIYMLFPAYAGFVSNDPDVVEQILELRFLISVQFVTSCGLVFMNEMLVKQGRVLIVMMTVAPLLWLVGIPLSLLLAPHYGVQGIQFSNTFAYGAAHILCTWHVMRSDWPLLAQQACERNQALEA